MALPAALRFRNRRDLRSLLRRGRRITTPLGRACLAHAAGRTGRILFVVSTAVAKKSTQRHRLKRRLEEWARSRGRANLAPFDIIVSVDRRAALASPGSLLDLAEEFGAAVGRLVQR